MPVMNASILVRAVQELEESPGALVNSRAVKDWCSQHHVDYGAGEFDHHFWNSDHEEARGQHRLLKFKSSPTKTGRNYFARRLDADPAPAGAAGHPGREAARAKGWVECVWKEPWDWENAEVPPP